MTKSDRIPAHTTVDDPVKGAHSLDGRRIVATLLVMLAVLPAAVSGQIPGEFQSTPSPTGEGWSAFTDLSFLWAAFLNLSLAMVLGAIIGYHPRRLRTADTLEEIEAQKVSVVYSVIGSLIGILVVEYGLVVGFVLFGIGGLIRFRSAMGSAQLTAQVIFATLVGLTCGLDLPHVAVLATVFDFGLTFLLEARVTYLIDVRDLPVDRFPEAVEAYRHALSGRDYHVLSEKKTPRQGRIQIIFRSSGPDPREHIESELAENVEAALRGSINWEVD